MPGRVSLTRVPSTPFGSICSSVRLHLSPFFALRSVDLVDLIFVDCEVGQKNALSVLEVLPSGGI